jgi:hypothetical protein
MIYTLRLLFPHLPNREELTFHHQFDISDDYDGDPRHATTPDVGADEFTGTVNNDPYPPVISYTPLGAGGIAASRNFSDVLITDDPSEVNTTSGTAPRVYFKKSTDANDLTGWKWVEGTGAGPFSFTIDYSLLNDGSVSTGDIIQYFVVAQDLYIPPNVGINSGTFEEQPSSVNLTAENFPIEGTINSYAIYGPISGTILVGTSETYTSLTAVDGLFNKINTSTIAGNIIVRITSDLLIETGAVALNQTNEEANYSITIQPDDASPKIISGNCADSGLIRLNGADRITIDGRYEGSGNGKFLTFKNTNNSASSATIQLISLGTNAGAKDITIRNCTIEAGHNGETTYGIAVGGFNLGSSGSDNDNLSIIDNEIMGAYYGIYIGGTLAGVDNNVTITGNNIGSDSDTKYIGRYGIYMERAENVNISGNTIFNIIIDTFSPYSGSIYGIYLSAGVTNALISRNKTHSLHYTKGDGGVATGIACLTFTSNANVRLINNLIYDITGDKIWVNLEDLVQGILLSGTQSGIKIYNNSIHLYGNTLSMFGAASTGIGLDDGSSAEIKNNIIVNNLGITDVGTGWGSYGIALSEASNQLESSDNNLIYVNPSGSGYKYIGLDTYDTECSDMESWRLATGQDKYSFSGDPAFTSNTNLLPDNTNSNCWAVNNKGMPLALVSTDFTGAPRSTTVAGGPVDIGAYEFTAGTPPPAAVQGGTIASDSTTTYNVFEFEAASIIWSGTNFPSNISFTYYSGIEPPKPNNPAKPTSKCYWAITPQNDGNDYKYDITFNYDEAQIGNIAESNLRIAKSDDNGLNWTAFLETDEYDLDILYNTITVFELDGFSLFTLTDDTDPLPVELNSFSAAPSGRDINLKWETETEVSSYGFEIERASSSTTPLQSQGWEKIGFVAGHGNSNSPKQYSFTDNNLNSGKYVYRLKMVDNDGSYEYSPEVETEIGVPKEYLLSQNYPNPFNPTTKIDYQLPFESSVKIELYNITGERVDVLVNQEQAAGYYTVEVNSTQFRLSSGVYIYRMTAVSTKDLKSYTQLKKMVLLK